MITPALELRGILINPDLKKSGNSESVPRQRVGGGVQLKEPGQHFEEIQTHVQQGHRGRGKGGGGGSESRGGRERGREGTGKVRGRGRGGGGGKKGELEGEGEREE